jgi:CheY-like chemotaxis protein
MANILVIDDDSAVATTVKLLLDRAGHNVVVANDGRNGLKAFESGQFVLVIIDIFMPEMDGLETIRLVHRQRPEVPILVISGDAFPTDSNPTPDFLDMATKLGAITSLRKPFKPAELLTAVAGCLEEASGMPGSSKLAPGKTSSDA